MRYRVVSKSVILFVIFSFLAVNTCCISFVHADQSSAGSDIASAQSKLIQCFDAAKAAENAGANISALTDTLNDAGFLLSKAELAYSSGDYSGADTLAIQSQNELISFVSTANSLQSNAEQKQNVNFLLDFVVPIASVMAIIVGSFVVWALLKRKYEPAGVQLHEPATV